MTIRVERRDVRVGPLGLEGGLAKPQSARGLVIFAHGSGSSRHSRRNVYVAERLQSVGLATLLFDLLTEQEGDNRANVFDIELLAERVENALDWAVSEPQTRGLKIGLFGASTGAAAALVAAAHRPQSVSAVVSRGGRPDLAGAFLGDVSAPTLLIVGGDDEPVLSLNREAFAQLTCAKRLDVVAGATHLFEEPGALDEVVKSAARWFESHLGGRK
jgi:dienelactone hydrolase